MPRFEAITIVETAPDGVTLQLPMQAGDATTVSEDEALLLRALPEQFREVLPWTATPQRNRMMAAPAVAKAEPTEG